MRNSLIACVATLGFLISNAAVADAARLDALHRQRDDVEARKESLRIEAEGGRLKEALAALQNIEAADANYDPPSARRVKAEARLFADKLRLR